MKEVVDSSVALDSLERHTRTVGVVDATELVPVDVDREAFELAQQAGREGGDKPATGLRALLVCSPGGHLVQMLSLEPSWRDLETTWVTLPGADVDYLLEGQDVVLGCGPTNRSLKNLIRNFRLAWRTVRDYRPDVILSTGAALAVPFFIVGRLHGTRCVYVESFTRINNLSVSGPDGLSVRTRLLRPVALADKALPQGRPCGERRLIFVTLGTHHDPFPRLIDGLQALDREELGRAVRALARPASCGGPCPVSSVRRADRSTSAPPTPW